MDPVPAGHCRERLFRFVGTLVGMARALQTQLDQLRRELARVPAVGYFGCAHEATLQAPPMPSLRRVRQCVFMVQRRAR